jgi:hypothetical protein
MDDYHAFTAALTDSLSARPEVLGLVALGSMAERGRLPDRWSDHDFFVITADPEPMRSTNAWLPGAAGIALWFRETPHGCKAVYDDGHLVEYAVFAPDELTLAKVNDYRVLIDRERIAERMAAVADASVSAPPDRSWVAGMFLSNVLVAGNRAARGELASARWMLTHAMRFLVVLCGGGPDGLDPLRRIDPANLERALTQDVRRGCVTLLDRYAILPDADHRALAAIRHALA